LRLIVRELRSKYQGSSFGVLWSFFMPMLMLGVYLFVFGYVFNARRGDQQANLSEFGLALFSGILVHGLLAECLNRSPAAIVAQPNYVKKVVFPLELLPLTVVGGALVQYGIGFTILLIAITVLQSAPLLAWAVPLALLPLIVLCAGVAFGLAALAVYVRDVAQLSGLLSTVLLFLSPVFYPVSALPEFLRPWMFLNPLTLPIETIRSLLLGGPLPPLFAWGSYSLIAVVVLWLGWAFFQATRRGFADVL
ncbi:MAG: ABC transporter permease, partial [Burkholderiaceae bacterium]|nr:ABC transporter permease [Burkholderiaceae bacterium]